MTKEAFDRIAAGLKDAISHLEGDGVPRKTHIIDTANVDIAAARKKLGMSQAPSALASAPAPCETRNKAADTSKEPPEFRR